MASRIDVQSMAFPAALDWFMSAQLLLPSASGSEATAAAETGRRPGDDDDADNGFAP